MVKIQTMLLFTFKKNCQRTIYFFFFLIHIFNSGLKALLFQIMYNLLFQNRTVGNIKQINEYRVSKNNWNSHINDNNFKGLQARENPNASLKSPVFVVYIL